MRLSSLLLLALLGAPIALLLYSQPSLAEELTIRRISSSHGPRKVYNIEVSRGHTYFVSHRGVLVHNKKGSERGSIIIGRSSNVKTTSPTKFENVEWIHEGVDGNFCDKYKLLKQAESKVGTLPEPTGFSEMGVQWKADGTRVRIDGPHLNSPYDHGKGNSNTHLHIDVGKRADGHWQRYYVDEDGKVVQY